MLLCERSLPGVHHVATASETFLRAGSRCISGQWFLAAALMALSGSIAIAHGQTDTPQTDALNVTLHPELCDGLSAGDQHKLSTKSRTLSAPPDGQRATRAESTLTKLPLRLSGIENSTGPSDEEVAQCKHDLNDAAEQSQPKTSAESADRPVLPQVDSGAPIVSYKDGELKVVGHGARLGSILEIVKSLTGIALDIPQDGAENQISDDIGPAPLRQALINLLDGARLNYLILGSSEDPQGIKQIILTAQTSTSQIGKPAPAAGLSTEQASGPALYGSGFGAASGPDTAIVEPVVPTPANSIPVNVNIQQAAASSGKTPGEVLDELQKKQLQQLDDQAAQSAPQ